uniref:Fibronectin type-III domain-containing protein n=1 Tax=Petromyzon marinus TaxID=7757 RepID=S4R6E3_PETMA
SAYTCGFDNNLPTSQTLSHGRDGTDNECEDYETSGANSCYFRRENLYLFVTYRIWVVAHNLLGNATSAVLSVDPMNVAQPSPPANVVVVGPPKYPKQLDVSWTYPSAADPSFYPLQFQLRYRRHGTSDWQDRRRRWARRWRTACTGCAPGRAHHVELRCRHSSGRGHWSEWS